MRAVATQLLEKIQAAISETALKNEIGIAFSGGVDSTLISKICSDMDYEITLLTVGFCDSHDVLFAKRVNSILNYRHRVLEIEPESFSFVASAVNKKINTENLSWNENCIAFYYVSKLASELNLDTVITANGIDELFCGYNAYRDAFPDGEDKIHEVMNTKLDNEVEMMRAVNLMASEFDVIIQQPLLSQPFVDFAKTIPISEKIRGSEDLFRKHIVRSLAKDIGVPEISYNKRKKALQYGSGIHKAMLKSRRIP